MYEVFFFFLCVYYCFYEMVMVTSAYFPCGSYPSLRVAYIDEVEEPIKEDKYIEASKDKSVDKGNDKFKPKVQKVYYSKLVKVPAKRGDANEPDQNLDQVNL